MLMIIQRVKTETLSDLRYKRSKSLQKVRRENHSMGIREEDDCLHRKLNQPNQISRLL